MKSLKIRGALLVLALCTGAVLVFVGNAATDLVSGRTPFEDGSLGSIGSIDVAYMHLAFTSAPMVMLAALGIRSRLLWGTAIGLSAAFWAFAVHQIWRASLTGFEGGADIGLGIIMSASPLFVLFGVWLVAWLTGRQKLPES